MKDESKGDLQIYQYFSDCLKNFRQRMLLLCKIANCDQQDMQRELEKNLASILNESTTLLDKFDEFAQNISNIQNIFSRFLLRVRQSVHSIGTKTSANQLVNFFKFLENIIKDFNFASNMKLIMKFILLKIPKSKTIQHTIPENPVLQKKFSDSNLKEVKQMVIVPETRSQKHFDSYDKYLQALERQYRLFDCLNIERSQYRRVFFLALEDIHRKDNNLLQEMLYRNRFTKQSMLTYEKNFEKQKKRQVQRKLKVIKTEQEISYIQMKAKEILHQNYTSKLKHQHYDEKISFSAPKRFKQEIDRQIQTQKKTNNIPLTADTLRNIPNKKVNNSFRERLKTANHPLPVELSISQEDLLGKNKLIEAQRQKGGKNINIIQLKKVQFKKNRLELAPQQIQKKNPVINEEDRRKNFYKRTQEHFRKKISIITQTKFPKNQYKSQFSPTKASKFNSLRIQFTQYLQ